MESQGRSRRQPSGLRRAELSDVPKGTVGALAILFEEHSLRTVFVSLQGPSFDLGRQSTDIQIQKVPET